MVLKAKTDELLAKLEAATGPDREIDRDLAVFDGWRVIDFRATNINGSTELVSAWFAEDATAEEIEHVQRSMRDEIAANLWGNYGEEYPSYTASIDTALALVERKLPGWAVTVATYHTTHGSPYADMGSRRYIESEAGFDNEYSEAAGATPALAILIALLRALGDTK